MALFSSLINKGFSRYLNNRVSEIEYFKRHPYQAQEQVLVDLLKKGQKTAFGEEHGFYPGMDYQAFARQVPIHDYPSLQPYIDRMLNGEQQVIWPSPVNWYAMSSGTTGGRSKFIPISKESLEYCHFKAGKDLFALYYQNNPEAQIATGKNLVLGGSHQINKLDQHSRYGDLSAVLMQNLPFWARWRRSPNMQIALMEDWEAKIDHIARQSLQQNITSMLGVPTWTVVLIEKLFEITGEDNLANIWPNLELYVHGGVSFEPYRDLFQQMIRKPDMHYMETYNASEGFFGIQDNLGYQDLLLMLDYGVFYEFIPTDIPPDQEKEAIVPLWQVEKDRQYAIVITTNAGLWRYKIGDTIRFTELNPFRFKLTGRTQHFINTFGEEVIVENAEAAIQKACDETGAIVGEYTAGPIYFTQERKKGGHEWILEFEKTPDELNHFKVSLDQGLREVNSDYAAKRYKDMALAPPVAHQMPANTFYQWMKARNKLGGQNKVPRLVNNREFLEDILHFQSPSLTV